MQHVAKDGKILKEVQSEHEKKKKITPWGKEVGGGSSYESTVNTDLQLRGCKSVAGFF